MRLWLICGLVLPVMAAGCPKPARKSPAPSPNTVTAPPEVTQAIPPETGDAIPPPTAPQGEGQLELDGLRLGMTYDSAKGITEEDGHRLTSGLWADTKGHNGLLMLTPADGKPLPADDLYFVDGQLAGYFKRLEMTPAEYEQGRKFHADLYGEPVAAPPAWAAGAAFFADMPGLADSSLRMFWSGEAGQELLFAQYDPATKRTLFGLVRPALMDQLGATYGDQLAAFDKPVSAPRGAPPVGGGATSTSGKTG